MRRFASKTNFKFSLLCKFVNFDNSFHMLQDKLMSTLGRYYLNFLEEKKIEVSDYAFGTRSKYNGNVGFFYRNQCKKWI